MKKFLCSAIMAMLVMFSWGNAHSAFVVIDDFSTRFSAINPYWSDGRIGYDVTALPQWPTTSFEDQEPGMIGDRSSSIFWTGEPEDTSLRVIPSVGRLSLSVGNPYIIPTTVGFTVTYENLTTHDFSSGSKFQFDVLSASGIINPLPVSLTVDGVSSSVNVSSLGTYSLEFSSFSGVDFSNVQTIVFGFSDGGLTGVDISFHNITTDVALVPIPGAVWLLASGLVGLVGLRKRFQN